MARISLTWRPSPEDETFALRHGMSPNGVAYALRHHWKVLSAAEGQTTDESTMFRDWVLRHAIEAPLFSHCFNGNVVFHGRAPTI
jgi:hypothetical protein